MASGFYVEEANMFFEGNSAVIDGLREKGRLQKEGRDCSHIRLLLVLTGGLMRGVNGAAILQRLLKRGFGSVFDRIVTASVGVPTASYFLAGQQGVESIFFEECCRKDFVSWLKFTLDRDYIFGVFQGKTKKGIEVGKVLSSKTKLTILTTDFRTGKAVYHVPNSEYDFWNVLKASMTVSALCPEPVSIDGRLQVDGGYADALPLARAVRDYNPTHVLVIVNGPRDGHDRLPLSESLSMRFLPFIRSRHSEELLKVALGRGRRFARSVRLALRCRLPVGIIWADKEPGPFCQKPDILKSAYTRASEWTEGMLDGKLLFN